MEIKRCTRCKEYLPINRFGKNASEKDGLCYYCKECKNLVNSRNSLKRERELKLLHDKVHETYTIKCMKDKNYDSRTNQRRKQSD